MHSRAWHAYPLAQASSIKGLLSRQLATKSRDGTKLGTVSAIYRIPIPETNISRIEQPASRVSLNLWKNKDDR
jgi:hypothetical protein